ncbi:MAG: hypothetical protein EOO92_04250, partial [Pedobacter sp.]
MNFATLTLTSDEPDYLAKSVQKIKTQLSCDVLLEKSKNLSDAHLLDLLNSIETQSRILDWLATASFSAHLYFSSQSELVPMSEWSEAKKISEFLMIPLVHRFSDKSISVVNLSSNVPKVDKFVRSVVNYVEANYHRNISIPVTSTRWRNPDKSLLELAELVLNCCLAYLAKPEESTTRAIFAHVRTRLKYATNVGTG